MSLSHVQSKGAAGGTSPSVTLDSTPTEGNLLVAWASSFVTLASITWPAGWTESFANYFNVGGNRRYEMRYKVAGASEPTTISVTGAGSDTTLAVSEYGGATWTAPDDTESVAAVSGTSISAPSITPTSGRQAVIVIAYSCWDTARTTTWPAGFTERYAGSASGNCSVAIASNLVESTTGSYDGTVSGTSQWGQAIGTHAFIADAGGGGGGGARFSAVFVG